MANKLGWSHDGTTFKVASDDVVVLQTPFTPDPAAGSILVYLLDGLWHTLPVGNAGQKLSVDPSGLAVAWDDVTISNTTTIYQVSNNNNPPLPMGPTTYEVGCGITLWCANALVEAYNVAASLFKALIQSVLSVVDAALKQQLQDGLAETAGPEVAWGTIALGLLLDVFAAVVGAVMTFELGPLSDDAIGNVQRGLWDVMQGEAGVLPFNTFGFDTTTQAAWDANITAHPGAFTQLQLLMLRLLIHYYQPQFWQRQMAVGYGAPSDVCPALEYVG